MILRTQLIFRSPVILHQYRHSLCKITRIRVKDFMQMSTSKSFLEILLRLIPYHLPRGSCGMLCKLFTKQWTATWRDLDDIDLPNGNKEDNTSFYKLSFFPLSLLFLFLVSSVLYPGGQKKVSDIDDSRKHIRSIFNDDGVLWDSLLIL